MKIIHRLRQVGRVAFKRESNLYKLGASAYHRLRPVLVRLSLDEPTGLDNAMQLAAIARASTTCRPRAGGKRIVFLTVRGWPVHLATETMLAARLRQMGHDVSFWICADSFAFCMFGSINFSEQQQHDCISCGKSKAFAPGVYFDTNRLHCSEEATQTIQASVAQLRIEECRKFEYRSEEHTSELQSQSNLVCRLLLEKKKNTVTSRCVSDERGDVNSHHGVHDPHVSRHVSQTDAP